MITFSLFVFILFPLGIKEIPLSHGLTRDECIQEAIKVEVQGSQLKHSLFLYTECRLELVL